jgi:hypothetical protein
MGVGEEVKRRTGKETHCGHLIRENSVLGHVSGCFKV